MVFIVSLAKETRLVTTATEVQQNIEEKMHYDAHYRGQSGQGATGERLNRLLMSAVVSTQMINVCEGSKHCPVIVRLEVRKEVVTAQ